ncbi:MAG: N-acetylmuramoyl-L-alanine amidase [Bacillota bacterium]|nr:N-acetylmuramoyl-L-alanine amidase [Bacillota bacterium]
MRFFIIARKKAIFLIGAAALTTVLIATGVVLGTVDWEAAGRSVPGRVYSFTVVIDAGHGGFDGGACGRATKVHEDGLNLDVAQKLKAELEQAGMTVIMTREDENALGSTKTEDMNRRRTIITNASSDLVLSIHMNFYPDSGCKGPAVFYMKGSELGQKAAVAVQDALNRGTGGRRRALAENYFVLRAGEKPCIIVECGFLSNHEEEQLLINSEYRTKIARLIAKGVYDYFDQIGGD